MDDVDVDVDVDDTVNGNLYNCNGKKECEHADDVDVDVDDDGIVDGAVLLLPTIS